MTRPASETPRRIFSVSEINRVSRMLLEDSLTDIWIEGEISNLRTPASGHLYFSLKDPQAEMAAVMFRSQLSLLKFRPDNGLQVLVNGRVSLYEARGTYQINVQSMEPRGRGALHLAFEQLKQRLAAEGLFAEARKRPIPLMPARIGVVTSPSGAALRDILQVLERRHAGIHVLIVPARVQGEGAAREIAEAIEQANSVGNVDVLIVGRGGGSVEDLWAFNEEVVARAIAASRLPIISAVGHEIDFTIADFAADLRAPTPSAAAELVAASRKEMGERVAGLGRRVSQALRLRLARARGLIEPLAAGAAPARLRERLERTGQRIDDLGQRLCRSAAIALERLRSRLDAAAARLQPSLRRDRLRLQSHATAALSLRLAAAVARCLAGARARLGETANALRSLSPLGVLERGYALCVNPATGALFTAFDQVRAGEAVEVRLGRGRLDCEVRATHPPTGEPR